MSPARRTFLHRHKRGLIVADVDDQAGKRVGAKACWLLLLEL
jgi:hypothetical protein